MGFLDFLREPKEGCEGQQDDAGTAGEGHTVLVTSEAALLAEQARRDAAGNVDVVEVVGLQVDQGGEKVVPFPAGGVGARPGVAQRCEATVLMHGIPPVPSPAGQGAVRAARPAGGAHLRPGSPVDATKEACVMFSLEGLMDAALEAEAEERLGQPSEGGHASAPTHTPSTRVAAIDDGSASAEPVERTVPIGPADFLESRVPEAAAQYNLATLMNCSGASVYFGLRNMGYILSLQGGKSCIAVEVYLNSSSPGYDGDLRDLAVCREWWKPVIEALGQISYPCAAGTHKLSNKATLRVRFGHLNQDGGFVFA